MQNSNNSEKTHQSEKKVNVDSNRESFFTRFCIYPALTLSSSFSSPFSFLIKATSSSMRSSSSSLSMLAYKKECSDNKTRRINLEIKIKAIELVAFQILSIIAIDPVDTRLYSGNLLIEISDNPPNSIPYIRGFYKRKINTDFKQGITVILMRMNLRKLLIV